MLRRQAHPSMELPFLGACIKHTGLWHAADAVLGRLLSGHGVGPVAKEQAALKPLAAQLVSMRQWVVSQRSRLAAGTASTSGSGATASDAPLDSEGGSSKDAAGARRRQWLGMVRGAAPRSLHALVGAVRERCLFLIAFELDGGAAGGAAAGRRRSQQLQRLRSNLGVVTA
eukprot:CAMPEP_0196791936 /NCGR_PEP_ID=MMETSP1104-20130614/30582_1 /TAXON_ID=33652 /ORGANISM="Cafeteria sp., Strain Caron Lab Isolate" /LENGTH=170 /DNA_ID=CAMNT_0042162299 /DNA_START=1 /DNA_END=509 /DNA_ORIENTATION=+